MRNTTRNKAYYAVFWIGLVLFSGRNIAYYALFRNICVWNAEYCILKCLVLFLVRSLISAEARLHYLDRKLSDWGLTHRGLVIRRLDGILWDFVDFFSESLNPNRLNPNQFAFFCGLFAEFCGFLRICLRNFAAFCEITKPQSAKPQSLNSRFLSTCH